MMDQVKVKPGEEYTVDGKKIPAVVTYSDTSGKIHNYVPVNMAFPSFMRKRRMNYHGY